MRNFCVTHKSRIENVKGFDVVFYDKEVNELEKCFQIYTYVQFVSYIFSQIDVKGEKDVERGEDFKGIFTREEEEKRFVDYLPECIKDCMHDCLAFCCCFCFYFCLSCLSPCEKCYRACKK